MTQTPSQKAARIIMDDIKTPNLTEEIVASLIATHTGCDEMEQLLQNIKEETLKPTNVSHDYDATPTATERLATIRTRVSNFLARLNPTKK